VATAVVRRQWVAYGGDPDDILAVNRAALDDLAGDTDEPRAVDCRVEGRVSISPTAELSHSVVLGPVAIGPGARIEYSVIGPYTAVGAGAVVENSEVMGSVLCEESVVRDVSTRLEASVVGPRAIVRGDFMLPRSLRVALGQDGMISLA
jgi:glucose-1-phosphate thymidylyltransferase